MNLKIGYSSDLHFEFHKHDSEWLPALPESCDVMVLAGDIGTKEGAIEAVKRIAGALLQAEIIFVAGNHEFYRSSIDNQLTIYREAFKDESRIHFLENDAVEIAGVSFLGCTLWSGFDVLGKEYTQPAMEGARRSIADFQLIRDRSDSTPFVPMSAIARYRESRLWLAKELKDSDPEKTVVVTHFPPCREARHKNIREDLLAAYFQANCLGLIEKYQPVAWIYGHNHWSDELKVGNTLVCSNQLGYPEEEGMIPLYDATKTFSI